MPLKSLMDSGELEIAPLARAPTAGLRRRLDLNLDEIGEAFG